MTKLKAIVFQMNQSQCLSTKPYSLIIILKHHLLSIYRCQHFTIVLHLFITTTTLTYYYAHFVDEATEVLRKDMVCLSWQRIKNKRKAISSLKTALSHLQYTLFTMCY